MSLNWLRSIGYPRPNRSKPEIGKPGRRWRSHLRLEILEDRRLLSIFTVLNTNDSGTGSLRQAILDANRGPFTNIIVFNIGGGRVQTIQPTSALPTITNHVVIDGTTQPGFAGTPLIVLNGSHAGAGTDGLTITAGSSTVQALVINGFSRHGINLMTNGGNVIVDDYLGTDATGTVAVGNGGDGVVILSSDNLVGATTAAARNVISGNHQNGISISGGSGNVIAGNSIGTDITGTRDRGNGNNGVEISDGINNTVGGTALGAGNLISGNTNAGVSAVQGAVASQVQGNYIGTDITGTQPLGNLIGVDLEATDNTVGGTVAGACNLVSGNRSNGIHITGSQAIRNLVAGNYIGTNAVGTVGLPNGSGVEIEGGARDNTVGGTDPAARNLISASFGAGVTIFKADGNETGHNLVASNYIGTDVTGTVALRNLLRGIFIPFSGDNIVAGNLISGNRGDGIALCAHVVCLNIPPQTGDASGNVIEGNKIGTDVTGTHALGNQGYGISIDGVGGTGIVVGGTTPDVRNIISGNGGAGVGLFDNATATVIEGNYIGTDRTGLAALANQGDGIRLARASGNTIGGSSDGAANLISGNMQNGVDVISGTGNVLAGNQIGTDATGTQALPNEAAGITIVDSNNTVGGTTPEARNLISGNAADGIRISGQHNVVQGNFIGTDLTGSLPLGNINGLSIQGSYNTIGGTTPGAGNLISANHTGVRLRGTDPANAPGGVVIEGNFIGTDVTGAEPLGNGTGVVLDLAFNNTVGGTLPGAGNVISGNGTGVSIAGQLAAGNQVWGNLIGTDATGTAALGNVLGVDASAPATQVNDNVIAGNSATGLLLGGYFMRAEGNLIGVDVTASSALGNGTGVVVSPCEGARITVVANVVSGNLGNGIEVGGCVSNMATAVLQHNWIGTDPTGSLDLGNAGYGIRVSNSGDTIGGTNAAAGNVIAFNGAGGVLVDTGTGDTILRNAIFGHDNGLGIELINGGNRNQAFPTLTSAVFDGSTTTITGTLASAPDLTYTIEIFVNSVCNPSGFGEGEQFFASLTVTTDDNGNAAFTLALPVAVDPGQFIAATATDPHGNTSEFSQCLEVTAPGQAGFAVAEFHGAVWPAALGLPLSEETPFDSPSGTPAVRSVPTLPGDLGAAPLNRTVSQEGLDLFFGADARVQSGAAVAWTDGFIDRAWDELTIRNPFFD